MRDELTHKKCELKKMLGDNSEKEYSKAQIKSLLGEIFIELNEARGKEEKFRHILRQIVSEIVLDPHSLECEIIYALPIDKKKMTRSKDNIELVLPRGLEPLFTP
jgi:hypothetical protein